MENRKRKPKGYWKTKDNCIADAARFKDIVSWANGSGSSYNAARKHGYLEECRAHMDSSYGQWQIKDNCMADAARYKSRASWNNGNGSGYASALKNGWLDECCAHMFSDRKKRWILANKRQLHKKRQSASKDKQLD